eukprot:15361914-Ditylum_brightwellii.AAC.1
MEHLGFKPCESDPDVWYCKANKPDGSAYREYVALYTYDCICCLFSPESVVRKEIGKYWSLK